MRAQVRARARAHLRHRHLQRRLPDALAAREPARPLRRRRRLGGHAVRPRAGANLLSFLPPALEHYPRYRATSDGAAHDAIIAAGFAPGSEFLWDDHYAVYWDLTQRTYREEFDPGWDGALDGGHAVLPVGDAELRRRLRLRAAAARPCARRSPRSPTRARSASRCSRCTGRSTPCCRSAWTPTSTRARSPARARGALHRYYVIEARQPRRRPLRHVPGPAAADAPVPPHRVPRAGGLGRAGRGAAGQPVRPARVGRCREHVRPAGGGHAGRRPGGAGLQAAAAAAAARHAAARPAGAVPLPRARPGAAASGRRAVGVLRPRRIRVRAGKRALRIAPRKRVRRARVGRACRSGARLLRRAPRSRLRVGARFGGNALLGARSRSVRVRVSR